MNEHLTSVNCQSVKKTKLSHAIRTTTRKLALSAVIAGAACSSWADASDVNEFSISSQPLGQALAQFSTQSGLQVVVNGDTVRTFSAPTLTGELSNEAALAQLLSNSGLVYEFRNDDTVIIKVAEGGDSREATKIEADEEVVITGSRLATDKSKVAGQILSYDSEYIKASGEITLERFLRRLPQNFGGTSEFAGNTLNNARNDTGASTVNLRGLGDRGTLILVDGHRRGFNGAVGGVTDISGIPLSQVERVEVFLDGASAIYGSDAVGGVINIITKKDYQGVTAGLEYTEPGQGSFNEYKFSLSGGTGWDGGYVRGAYEYEKRTGLLASDSVLSLTATQTAPPDFANPPRPGLLGQIVSAPFPALTLFYNGPSGSISVFDFNALDAAAQADFTPVFSATLPEGFNQDSDFRDISVFMTTDNSFRGTGDADRGSLLLPERESHSFSVSVSQELSDSVNLKSSLSYSQRDVVSGGAVPQLNTRVARNNPFNPLPGRFYDYIVLLPDLGARSFNTSDSDQWDFTFDVDGSLSENWSWTASGEYSRASVNGVQAPRLDLRTIEAGTDSDGLPREVRVAVGAAAPSSECTFNRFQPGAGFIPARDIYDCPTPAPINPFGDLSSFLLSEQFSDNRNELAVVGGYVKGKLFSLPAGDVSVLAGIEWSDRKIDSASEFAIGAITGSTVVGADPFAASISRDSKAAYMETSIPLISDSNSLPLLQSLDLTVSGRYDSYGAADATRTLDPTTVDLTDPEIAAEFESFNSPSDIGGDSSWGSGLIWTVNDELRLRANVQTAFVAPQLNQLFASTDPRFSVGFAFLFLQDEEGNLEFLNFDGALGGGNSQLEAENSRSKSYSVEYSPEFVPNLTATLTYAQTDYRNRITSLNSNGAIVTLDNLPSDILLRPVAAGEGALDRDANGNLVRADPSDPNSGTLELFLDTRFTNAERLSRAGYDLNLNYVVDSDFGEFSADLAIAKVTRHAFSPDANDDPIDVVRSSDDSRFFGLPKYSTNLQLSWYLNGLSASISANARGDTNRLTRNGDGEVTVIQTTKSVDSVNLTMSYDFENGELFESPAWMSGMVATLGIENLTNEFSETTTNNLVTGEVTVDTANPIAALGRGRVFNFRIQKEF